MCGFGWNDPTSCINSEEVYPELYNKICCSYWIDEPSDSDMEVSTTLNVDHFHNLI